jgi:hypothetical protein
MLYRQAYKGVKTGLLTWVFVGLLISFMRAMGDFAELEGIEQVVGAVNSVVIVCVAICCFRLRRLNKGLQENAIKGSEEYVKFMTVLDQAKNMEELNLAFAGFTKETVDVNITLLTAYKVKKKALANA